MKLKRTVLVTLTALTLFGTLATRANGADPGHAQHGAGTSESSQARQQLLVDAEDVLRRGDAVRAGRLFEQAASLAHTADAELGLIRTLMQLGEYRHAIAFSAHTAGVHLDETAGAALYAWLLHVGGQARVAAVLLDRARERDPDDTMLRRTSLLLKSPIPAPDEELLHPPARFAPYSAGSDKMPASARTAASGVLIDGGRKVLTSAAALGRAPRIWVRNGIGASSPASFVRMLPDGDLAELELERPLQDARIAMSARAPYPGSPGFTVEFAAPGRASPAWPVLRLGFLGRMDPLYPGIYALGIDMPVGARGGPVFDAAGRLIGIAVTDHMGRDKLVSIARANEGLSGNQREISKTAEVERREVDEIYERALMNTVQVIVAP
jgi:S1-C subfamily serine protease